MSPRDDLTRKIAEGFPRMSGDEPIMLNRYMPATKFSPHERG